MAHLAHISDIHFGKIASMRIVDALVEDVNGSGVDLVAASGDLTQRAFPTQFKAARALLDSFDAPWLAVPGNHDVYPWWRPGSRLVNPVRRFREYICDDPYPQCALPGADVVGINSAHGWTVMSGRLGPRDREAIRDGFLGAAGSAALGADGSAALGAQQAPASPASRPVRILVVHHHLHLLQEVGPHDVSRGATKALHAAAEASVDLILCGHLHVSHIEHVMTTRPGREPGARATAEHRIVIASAGTATSTRGRRSNRHTNFYNQIRTGEDWFEVEERRYDPDLGRFETTRAQRFDVED